LALGRCPDWVLVRLVLNNGVASEDGILPCRRYRDSDAGSSVLSPYLTTFHVMSLQKFSEILLKNLCGVLQVFNDCEENGLQFRVRQRPEELAQVGDVDSFIFVLGAFSNFFFRP
jgi:hypothetical protein